MSTSLLPQPDQVRAATGDLEGTQTRTGSIKRQNLFVKGLVTLILAAGAVVILTPIFWMISASLKDVNQIRQRSMTLLPLKYTLVEVNGSMEPLYEVTVDGQTREMALIKKQPQGMGIFVDPSNPDEEFILKIDEQRQLEHLEAHPENFREALTKAPFGRFLVNTLIVTFVGMFGVLFSSSLVAYGFSRFRAPAINALFLVLLATIMLPQQVTLIPLYVLFSKIGWVDTLLPLIVPAFFANAYDVFLLRQFFMTIPLDMDDAARIDGANPLQVLWYIILPLHLRLERFLRAADLPAIPRELDAGGWAPVVQCGLYDQYPRDHGRIAADDHSAHHHLLPEPAHLHAGRRNQRCEGIVI